MVNTQASSELQREALFVNAGIPPIYGMLILTVELAEVTDDGIQRFWLGKTGTA